MYQYKDPNAVVGAGGVTQGQAEQTGLGANNSPSKLSPEEAARVDAQAQQRSNAIDRGYRNLAMASGSVKSAISKNLEGATLKIGTGGEWTYDTGIAWTNKKSLAAAIAFGDQVGDSVRGIKQLMQENGWADDLIDIQAQNQNEDILRLLYGDDEFGAAALTGGGMGMVAEPVGLLLPFGKAKSVGKAMLGAAAIGGLYGSTLYVDENESRLANAAMTAALMGPIAGIAQRYFAHTVGDDAAKIIKDNLGDEVSPGFFLKEGADDIEEITMKGGVDGKSKNFEKRYGNYGVDELPFEEITMRGNNHFSVTRGMAKGSTQMTKKQEKQLKKEKAARKAKEPSPEEVLESIEVKAAMEGKRHAKTSQFRAAVDSVLQPLYDNVRRYSGKVAHGLRNADAMQHRRQHVWSQKIKPWQDFITKKLAPEAQAQLKKLLSNGGFNKATMTFIRQQGGDEAVTYAKSVRETLDEVMSLYKEVGYKMGDGRPDYHPLSVKDLDGLRKREISALDRVYAREQKRQGGRALTPNQKAHIAEHYFTFDVRYSNTSGSLKGRKKQSVADDELEFYHNPSDALHYYIHTAAEDIAKREFFKSFGHKPKSKKGLNATGTDIDESIVSLIDQIKKDVPSFKDQQEITNLLRSRFSADVHKTAAWVQGLKNMSYAGTLGNYWSAMTQVGDLVFALHKYGIRSTVGAMFGPKVTSRAELGVEKAMAELQSETKGVTSKVADWAFKWSGFDAVDRFGKNVNINAALRTNKRLAIKNPQKFMEKYGDKFGDDTQALLTELQHMKLTKNNQGLSDNMYAMLWNELADTQPIGLSEMPQKYLDMPNGRIVYAYKTFAMKQLNYMRNMLNNDQNAFRKAANLTYFASAFVLANSSIDGFKDFMAGKELHMEDKVFDNLVSLAGTSKYAVDKSTGLGSIILQGLAPVPLTQLGKAVDTITGSKDSWADVGSKALNQLPVVGKLKKEWLDQ